MYQANKVFSFVIGLFSLPYSVLDLTDIGQIRTQSDKIGICCHLSVWSMSFNYLFHSE